MGALYEVSAADIQDIQALTQRVLQLLQNPDGSPVDPRRLKQFLKDELESIGDYQPPVPTEFDPDEFLYLSLPAKVLATPIEDLSLSTRTFLCVLREGIRTLGELLERSETELMDIRNFGAKGLAEVKARLGADLHLSHHDQGLAPPPGDEWVHIMARTILRSRIPSVRPDELKASDSSRQVLFLLRWTFGIETVGELLAHSRARLLDLNWASHKSGSGSDASPLIPVVALERIDRALAYYGLRLVDEAEST